MDVVTWDWFPYGLHTPPLTAAAEAEGWCKADTSAAGAPTLVAGSGLLTGTLANSDEVENLCLYHGDALNFDIDNLLTADFWLSVGAAITTAQSLAFGMIAARNDDPDAIVANAMFRCIASGSVVVETDDGTNDNDDKATGQTLGTTVKRFCIDFASGLYTKSPPSASVGGKGNVLFSMDDGSGNLIGVARSTLFDMSNYSSGLQPFVQLQKTGGVTTPSFSLARVRIRSKFPY